MVLTLRPGRKERLIDASPSSADPWYINDHTLVRDDEGIWHLFGIWHAEPAAPLDETKFLHASAPKLSFDSWKVHEPVLHARNDLGETHVWAPHVIRHDGRYWMFYCGGTEDHERYRMELATSEDLFTWKHHEAGPLFEDGFDARDPMVIQDGSGWLMYYTRTSTPSGGNHQIAVRRSDNLIDWSEPMVAYQSSQSGTFGGPTESPFVVHLNDQWLLFVCESGEYDRTLVYASDDPLHFDDDNAIEIDLDEHCAEIVTDGETMWITGGGWARGGLTIRELTVTDTR